MPTLFFRRVTLSVLVLWFGETSSWANTLSDCQRGLDYLKAHSASADSATITRSISACTRIIKSKSESSSNLRIALLVRGHLYAARGEHNLAIADQSMSIQIDPNSATAYYFRGESLSAKGSYDRAIADLTKAIELDPDALAHMSRGRAYQAVGDFRKALDDLRIAAGLLPSGQMLDDTLSQIAEIEAVTPHLPKKTEERPASSKESVRARLKDETSSLKVQFWTRKRTLKSLVFRLTNRGYTAESIRGHVSQVSPGSELSDVHMDLAGDVDQRMREAVKVFSELHQTIGNSSPIVSIRSDGGLVDIGIEIGRILFDRGATVIVNGDCMSSCLYVYAGGHSRFVGPEGKIGIHRPFSKEAIGGLTSTKYRELMRPAFSSVASYFEEMGVSAEVLETMRSTPSSQIRFLNREELDSWGLGYENVIAKELERNKILMRCGEEYVSKYYSAEEQVRLRCLDPDTYSNCRKEIEKSFGVEDGRRCARMRTERTCGEAFAVELYSALASIDDCRTEQCRSTLREKVSSMRVTCPIDEISERDY